MKKSAEQEATVEILHPHDYAGNAKMFAFDPGDPPSEAYKNNGDFPLTSIAAAWFLRAQVVGWMDHAALTRPPSDFTEDLLLQELHNMRLNALDLAGLRNLLVTAVTVIDSANRWERLIYDKATETRKHSTNGPNGIVG